MSARTVRGILLVAAGGAPLAGWWAAHPTPSAVAATPVLQRPGVTIVSGPSQADALVGRARHMTPFRPGHRLAPLRFGEAPPPAPPPPPAPAARPVLILTGLVTRPDTVVLLEGVPGQEGAVVLRPGTTIGGVTLGRVVEGRAVVQGFDTTWVLPMREPWRP